MMMSLRMIIGRHHRVPTGSLFFRGFSSKKLNVLSGNDSDLEDKKLNDKKTQNTELKPSTDPLSPRQMINIINSIKPQKKPVKEILKDPNAPEWYKQKVALKEKFGDSGWNPNRKISRDDMNSIKYLKQVRPELNNTQLGQYFRVSPEAVRRILKSKWEPKEEEEDKMGQRWSNRKERIQRMKYAEENDEESDGAIDFITDKEKGRWRKGASAGGVLQKKKQKRNKTKRVVYDIKDMAF